MKTGLRDYLEMSGVAQSAGVDPVLIQATATILFWFLLGLFIGYLLGRSRGYIIGRRQRELSDVWAEWRRTHPDEEVSRRP